MSHASPTASTSDVNRRLQSLNDTPDYFGAVVLSPWLWGPLLTIGFYSAAPMLPPQYQPLMQRYFCSNWILYVTTSLFFLGMCILARKGLRLGSETGALKLDLLAPLHGFENAPALLRADRLLQAVAVLPPHLRRTAFVTRLSETCRYVVNRSGARGLEDHLKYLAELAAGNLHSSYAFVRTITWAIPILGFLGTVLGITMAIGNVTPEQLNTSLGEVTAGLAVAFDTTALSLALSMVLVFTSFVIERAESQILGQVEDIAHGRLGPLFHTPDEDEKSNPIVAAEARAAEQLLHSTESLISRQTELWLKSLDQLRDRWTRLADQQQTALSSALQQGLQTALEHHTRQLSLMREELTESLQSVSQQLSASAATMQSSSEKTVVHFTEQTARLWDRLSTELTAATEAQAANSSSAIEAVTVSLAEWRRASEQSTTALHDQSQALLQQGEALLKISEQTQQLSQLESALQRNLETVRAVSTFEDAIHSLNAAVHLMTARSRHAA
jgi:biopolymer transport protein ExbB/TolQ